MFITSNNEKLPDAFLRRCFFHYIKFPEAETMKKIVDVHFPTLKSELLTAAMKTFLRRARPAGTEEKTSTSRAHRLAQTAGGRGDPARSPAKRGQQGQRAAAGGALLKNEQDVSLFEKLVFMNQRNR